MTIEQLSAAHGMQPYELRAFCDDLLTGLHDGDAIPARRLRLIRAALRQSESL